MRTSSKTQIQTSNNENNTSFKDRSSTSVTFQNYNECAKSLTPSPKYDSSGKSVLEEANTNIRQ